MAEENGESKATNAPIDEELDAFYQLMEVIIRHVVADLETVFPGRKNNGQPNLIRPAHEAIMDSVINRLEKAGHDKLLIQRRIRFDEGISDERLCEIIANALADEYSRREQLLISGPP